jgi:Holliday junction DNA helicase RuvA
MIERLVGQCVLRHPHGIILDVGGVGYGVEMTAHAVSRIQELESLTLWIYTHLSEDALRLFGFLTHEERQLFSILLSISRIGPKLALSILSALEAKRLVEIVEREDAATLAKVPGIGAQSAKKFILELKPMLEKQMPTWLFEAKSSSGQRMGGHGAPREVMRDVRLALENFGYKDREISPILKRFERSASELNLSEMIRVALQELAKGPQGVYTKEEEIF